MKRLFIFSSVYLLLAACNSDDSETINPVNNNPDTTEMSTPEEMVPNNNIQDTTEVDIPEEMTPLPPSEEIIPKEEPRITYNKNIAPLIEQRCFMCHNDPTDNGAPIDAIFTNFENVSEFAAAINFRVGNGTMPNAQGGGALPQEERDLFDDWVKGGLLED